MHEKTVTEKEIVKAARCSRPSCIRCGTYMEPQYERRERTCQTSTGRHTVSFIVGVRGYGYNSSNLFCTLRCGFDWAVDHAKGDDNAPTTSDTSRAQSR